MNKFDNVIFDFDGTLANTAKGVMEAVRFALDSLSISNVVVDDSVVGPSPFHLYNKFYELNLETAKKAVILHREYGEKEGYKSATIYKDVPKSLLQLKESGIKLYIVSLKKKSVIDKILKNNELDKLFAKIIGISDDETVSKQDLLTKLAGAFDFTKTLYVGDTYQDYECCKTIGMPFCFANYGFGHLSEKCEYRINAFRDLIQICTEVE